MSVKWGLLSTALINEAIIAGAAESPDVDVVSVASRDEARANAYADQHGLERSYGSYEALLAAGDLDVGRGLADTRFDPALEGGALMDVGTYCVNALRLFGGEPLRARGEQVAGPSGVDVVFAGALAFENEVVGVFDCGFVYPRRVGLELVGANGSIFVAQPFTIHEPGIELRRPDGEPEQIGVEPANSYRLELENVSAAIRGEAPLLLGREDAVGQARA